MLKLVFAQHWKKTSKMKMPTEQSKKTTFPVGLATSNFQGMSTEPQGIISQKKFSYNFIASCVL